MRRCDVEGCDREHNARGYCSAHEKRIKKGTPLDAPFRKRWGPDEERLMPPHRFMARVEKAESGCWLWTGFLRDDGYGQTPGGYGGAAHRVAYRLFRGEIPDGLTLDHLCRVRHCVNPDHLEPVTHEENVARAVEMRTHCKNGHEYTPENTYRGGKKKRACRECNRAAAARYRQKKAAA